MIILNVYSTQYSVSPTQFGIQGVPMAYKYNAKPVVSRQDRITAAHCYKKGRVDIGLLSLPNNNVDIREYPLQIFLNTSMCLSTTSVTVYALLYCRSYFFIILTTVVVKWFSKIVEVKYFKCK